MRGLKGSMPESLILALFLGLNETIISRTKAPGVLIRKTTAKHLVHHLFSLMELKI